MTPEELGISLEPETGSEDRTPIPKGHYPLTVEALSPQEIKGNIGLLTSGMFRVAEGPYAGYVIFKNFILKHASIDAVRVGKSQLRSLYLAAGVDPRSDFEDLLGSTVMAAVDIKPACGGYPAQNVIRRFYPMPTAAGTKPDAGEDIKGVVF